MLKKMTVRTGKRQAKLRQNMGGFVLKKKLCLFIFLQMTVLLFYAQAKKQNRVRQKKEDLLKDSDILGGKQPLFDFRFPALISAEFRHIQKP